MPCQPNDVQKLVGDVAEFAVLRDGKPLKIQATVAERDQRGRAK
jgi:hypothetical protein